MKNPVKKPVVGVASYILDCDFKVNSYGKLELFLPVVELPEIDGPLLSDFIFGWSKDAGLSEGVFSSCCDAAKTAFLKAAEIGSISEALAGKMTKVAVVKASYDDAY